jgi:hypothetical protein
MTFLSDEHTSSNPKYPDVEVQLSGEDGNIFGIIGKIGKALRRAGYEKQEVEEFSQMMFASESYDEALQNAMRTVVVH